MAGVADGSYVEVKREELLGICPLQVVKHPVSGKMRLVQIKVDQRSFAERQVQDGVAVQRVGGRSGGR